MADESRKHLKSALEEARDLYWKTQIPRNYFEALYFAQFFEIILENLYALLVKRGEKYFTGIGLNYKPEKRDNWTIDKYLKRLKTFFPQDLYKSHYEKLELAKFRRNEFIHKCFKSKSGDRYIINSDIEDIHLDARSLKIVKEWIAAYREAVNPLIEFILTVKKAKQS